MYWPEQAQVVAERYILWYHLILICTTVGKTYHLARHDGFLVEVPRLLFDTIISLDLTM
jgi:hypothetical protein